MAITRFTTDQFDDNSISTPKIIDKNVTSAKLEDNISIRGYATIGGNARIIAYPSYAGMFTPSGGATGIAAGQLLISNVYTDWSKVPTNGSYIKGNVTIDGDLTVNGDQTIITTTVLQVSDNIMTLNSDVTGTPTENAGIEVERGTSANVSLQWDEANKYWTLTNNGTNYYRIVDKNLADSTYVSKTSASFTDPVTITSASDNILQLKQTVSSGQTAYNYIEFLSDTATSGTYTRKAYAGMVGDTVFSIKAEASGAYIQLDNNVTVTGNITLSTGNATVDGVDISAFKSAYDTHTGNTTIHHSSTNDPTADQKAALAGTSGTPSDTNRYVTNSDARLTGSRDPNSHALVGSVHTVSGLTVGHVLRATGTTTYAFGQVSHNDLGGVTEDQHHAKIHDINGTDHNGAPLKVSKGGTGLTAVTSGYILFGNTADALGTNSNLFWDSTNSRLGLCDPTPPYTLTCNGSAMFNTQSNVTPFRIARNGGEAECLSIGLTDLNTAFNYVNDETSSTITFTMTNNDIANSGANANTNVVMTLLSNTGGGHVGINKTPSEALDVSGNIAVSGTVDGRDVSADGGKLDTLESIRSKRGRSTTQLTTAIAQAATYTASGISWTSSNIVFVIVDGQVNAPGLDYTLGSSNTIVFNYDIPIESILDIVVL